MSPPRPRLAPLLAFVVAVSACGSDTGPRTAPPGREESTKTDVLEAGAKILQPDSPLEPMDVYLVGFHPMKDMPAHSMEAHHFCRQVNEDFAQCVLFDGNSPTANLNGIEYIVSAALYDTLPAAERVFWHPHNHEILSGELVAPGIPEVAEKALMRQKINSYGKTWHVWDTGAPGRPGDRLPVGPAHLAWSFNREGELPPGMREARDRRMGIDSQARRRQRADLVELARPQAGVDALAGRFGRETHAIPGVRDAKAAPMR